MAEADLNPMIADLIAFQADRPHLKKDTKGNFGTYISLDAIHDTVLPVLTTHNFAWVTRPGYNENGDPVLSYTLLHVSGDTVEGVMPLIIDKQNSQGMGSAITYARRYAICSVLGLTADDDDDGKEASKTEVQRIDVARLKRQTAYAANALNVHVDEFAKALGVATMNDTQRQAEAFAKVEAKTHVFQLDEHGALKLVKV